MKRYQHTAWTPSLLADSIVLLGGFDGNAALLTAEIIPSIEMRSKFGLNGPS